MPSNRYVFVPVAPETSTQQVVIPPLDPWHCAVVGVFVAHADPESNERAALKLLTWLRLKMTF